MRKEDEISLNVGVDTYYMGADYNSDEGRFSICIMDKDKDMIICMYNGRTADPKEYEKEVDKVATYYKIPDNHILKETR